MQPVEQRGHEPLWARRYILMSRLLDTSVSIYLLHKHCEQKQVSRREREREGLPHDGLMNGFHLPATSFDITYSSLSEQNRALLQTPTNWSHFLCSFHFSLPLMYSSSSPVIATVLR